MWHLTTCKISVSLSFLKWFFFLLYLWINVANKCSFHFNPVQKRKNVFKYICVQNVNNYIYLLINVAQNKLHCYKTERRFYLMSKIFRILLNIQNLWEQFWNLQTSVSESVTCLDFISASRSFISDTFLPTMPFPLRIQSSAKTRTVALDLKI